MNFGIIGTGGISGAHLPAYTQLVDAQLVALCDTNAERLQARAVPGATLYADYHALLADPAVEAVDICLPTDLHADVTVAALEAGKHVLCEKPMALTVADCDRMLAAAARSGRILMVAHCLRFWPEYDALKAIVESGEYGRVLSAHFLRVGGVPRWSSDGWMLDPRRSGGAALDLHIHDADYIAHLFGLPKQVRARGVESPLGMNHIRVCYDYGDDRMITAEGAWFAPESYPFQAAFRVVLEGATVQQDRGPFTIYPNDGAAITPEIPEDSAYTNEVRYFLDCAARGEQPAIAPPFSSRETIRLVAAEVEAARSGGLVAL